MNPVNKALLWLALLPGGLYRRIGADTGLVSAILRTKLILDDRRPNTMQQLGRQQRAKPVSSATLGTMFISALMGALYLFAFALGTDRGTQLTVYFSMFLVLLSSMLIADFTSVLLDVRDNFIILTRPVNDTTILVSRLLHICIHLAKLVLPMCLPGAIYLGLNDGIGAVFPFLLGVVLLTLFAIFFINAIYLLAMRLVSPQKFQAVISYIQVGLAILIYASYQVVPALLGSFENLSYRVGDHPYALLLPPFWFAAGFKIFMAGTTVFEKWGAAMGFVLPLVSIAVVVRYLAPSFIRNLTLASNNEVTAPQPSVTRTEQRGLANRLAGLLTRSAYQRAGFLIAWRLSGRHRDFRMQVLPAIGYMLVYTGVIIGRRVWRSGLDVAGFAEQNKGLFVAALYFGAYALIVAIMQMRFSEKWKAGWVYFATPLERPGEVMAGAFKAMAAKFFLPLAILLLALGIASSGLRLVPNFLLGLTNQLLIAAVIMRATNRQLPFASPTQMQQKGGNVLRSILTLSLGAAIGGLHYLIYDWLPVVALCLLLSLTALWLLFNSIRQTSWETVKNTAE